MDFYYSLLQSYDKLKKRKLIFEASKMSFEAESKAKHYVQMAVAVKDTENYIVTISELGANAKIFVSRNGKSAGNVVVDNVISRYPIKIADGLGNPITIGPAWNQFVGKFNKIEKELEIPQQPQQQITPGVVMPQQSEFTLDLMDSANILVGLARDNKFFGISKSLVSPEWANPGPMGDYSSILRRVSGPDPFSVESKVNNGNSFEMNELTGLPILKPLHEEDKKLIAKTFKGFCDRIGKIYSGDFKEEDAIWINKRVFYDKHGVWIKDPILLSNGVCLSWKYSTSDQGKSFLQHLIDKYNEIYKNWAAEHNLPSDKIITITNGNSVYNIKFNELNYTRGISSEHLKIAIHALLNKDPVKAATIIQQVAQEFGATLDQAFQVSLPFKEGYSITDSGTLAYEAVKEELAKLTGQVDQNSMAILRILPRLVVLEGESLLVRKPLAVDSVGKKSGLGFHADLLEHYTSTDEVQSLLIDRYRFDPNAAAEFGANNTLNVGLKTNIRESDVHMSNASLFATMTSLFDSRSNPFIQQTINTFSTESEAKECSQKVQQVTKVLNAVFANVNVPGYSGETITKSNIKSFFEKIREGAPYDDLSYVDDLESVDISQEYTKTKLKSLLERKMVTGLIKRKINLRKDGVLTEEAKKWRRFLAATIFAVGGSLENQLDEIRYLQTGRVYFMDHNKALRDQLQGFVNGTIDIEENNFLAISFTNPASKRRLFKIQFVQSSPKSFNNNIELVYYKNFIKTQSTRALIAPTVKESVEHILESLQKALLHNSLS